MIHYSVSFEKANQHLFDVKLKLDTCLSKGQTFFLPNWIPGSYMIRDFARNIVTLSATSKKKSVALQKLDKSTWQLLEDVDCLQLEYQVYAWDLSVRSAHLDNQHAFFNGTSLFLGVSGLEDQVCWLQIIASEHARKNDWKVATAMSSKDIDSHGFGDYFASDYAELIDHPFEVSNWVSLEFDVCGVDHQMVFTEAPERVDWQRVAKDVQKICETEVSFFGDEKPPFERYLFMTFVQKKGFGGLEHMDSTALHCSFADLPLVGDDQEKISPEYRTFLSLCCHEYFHCWNVKRIKPARFIPMDLSKEIHTQLLWFFEGITSYYDELLMARAGVIETTDYLDMLAQTITRVMRSTGRHKQTVTDSSFDAWTRFYKQDENANNAIISYYTKGALVALCLDFEIRRLTNDKHSLDDLMRQIWQQFGKTGQGLGETQVKQLVSELVGQPMEAFFDKALYSTEELPLQNLFEQLGVDYQLLPQNTQDEKGGYRKKTKPHKAVSFLGLTHRPDPLGLKVVSVAEASCACQAGISNADIIIAIDNLRVTSSEIDKMVAQIPLGTKITISYFRRERLYHCECLLTEAEANSCYLSLKDSAVTPELLDWVHGSA